MIPGSNITLSWNLLISEQNLMKHINIVQYLYMKFSDHYLVNYLINFFL